MFNAITRRIDALCRWGLVAAALMAATGGDLWAFQAGGTLAIDGPTRTQPGRLLTLKAKIEANETPFWIVLQPVDLEYRQVNEGRELICVAGCRDQKEIVVLLLAQQVIEGRITTRQIKRSIQIGQTDIPADDGAGTQPAPPFRDDGFDRSVTTAVDQLPVAAKRKSLQVAENFLQMAKLCKSGQIKQTGAITAGLQRMNRLTLGADLDSWQPFARAVQQEFKRLQLKQPAAHVPYLERISSLLRR